MIAIWSVFKFSSYFGGAVLDCGAVQEEILLLQFPEALIGILLFDKLAANEAVEVHGLRRFNVCNGYSSSMNWSGPANLESMTCSRSLIAIDAQQYTQKTSESQFWKIMIDRDILKAQTGFLQPLCAQTPMPVGSGFWGCGIFLVT
jgi:poly(ADP-ribose) glycohydrolase